MRAQREIWNLSGLRGWPPDAQALALAVAVAVASCGGRAGNDAGDDTSDTDAAGDVGDAGDNGDTGDAGDWDADGGADAPIPPGGWTPPENISNTARMSDIRYQWGRSMASGGDGVIHVVWREVEGEVGAVVIGKVVYRRLDADGWSTVQDITPTAGGTGHPKVAVSGSSVYVVWHVHEPEPAADDRILVSVSGSGGAEGTFSAPRVIVSDAAVTPLNPLDEYSTTPSVAAWGDTVHVVWSDERTVAACGAQVPEVYLVTSMDRGATWSAVREVSEQDCRSSWTPSVAAWGGVVHVAWTDERHDAIDCGLVAGSMCREEEYYRRLEDHGASPAPAEVRLTRDDPGSEAESWGPSIAAWEGNVQVVWYDRIGGNDFEAYHARSLDGGVTWSDPAARLSTHAAGCLSACATIAAEGLAVQAVWFEMCGDASATILGAWSGDLGATWSGPSDVTSGTGVFAVHPHVAYTDGRVHVVWNENSTGEIFHAASE